MYVFSKGYQPVPAEDVTGVQNPKKCNVMVSYHGHEWVVAKNDVSEDEIPLLKNDAHVEKSSPFYKCEIEALNDFDMKSCTEHLQKAGIALELDADLYIPTAGQLAAMYLYREKLNKALEMVGGTPMKEKVYWSSSEDGAWTSWGVAFGSGYVGYWGYKFDGGCVRPCAAFELRKGV